MQTIDATYVKTQDGADDCADFESYCRVKEKAHAAETTLTYRQNFGR